MRFHSLKNWKDLKELEGLAFFAQLMEELLFDFSLDTYKASALNASSLCKEALEVAGDVIDGAIDPSHLKIVLEELEASCRRDEVAKEILGDDLESLFRQIKLNEGSLALKKTTIELLSAHLDTIPYKACLERILKTAIQDPREKNRIRRLTRSYTTHLHNVGYDSAFVYPLVRSHFHGNHAVEELDHIDAFFELFAGKRNNYVVIFKASSLFNDISSSCESLGLQVSASLPDHDADLERHNFSLVVGET